MHSMIDVFCFNCHMMSIVIYYIEKGGLIIMKYVCDICGWVYDEDEGYEEGGIAPGTWYSILNSYFLFSLKNLYKVLSLFE